jgi:acyl carrier protein
MVFEKIRAMICEQLDLDEDQVTMESDIIDDFDADSLDIVDLIVSVEEEFEVKVPDGEVENFRVVGDVVRYIEDNQ